MTIYSIRLEDQTYTEEFEIVSDDTILVGDTIEGYYDCIGAYSSFEVVKRIVCIKKPESVFTSAQIILIVKKF